MGFAVLERLVLVFASSIGVSACGGVQTGPEASAESSRGTARLRLRLTKARSSEGEPVRAHLLVSAPLGEADEWRQSLTHAVVSVRRAGIERSASIPPREVESSSGSVELIVELNTCDLTSALAPGRWELESRLALGGGSDHCESLVFTVDPVAGIDLPAGVPPPVREAFADLDRLSPAFIELSRPGWAHAPMDPAVIAQFERLAREHAPGVIEGLISALRSHKTRAAATEVLAQLRITDAVPVLIESLHLESCDHDSLLVAKLAELTNHPDGALHYRRYRGRERATKQAYLEWWERNRPR